MVNYELLFCFLAVLATHRLKGVALRGAEHGRTLRTHCSQGQDVISLNEGRNHSKFRK
jgi:hypothetical protein